jgi:hypothetical protein
MEISNPLDLEFIQKLTSAKFYLTYNQEKYPHGNPEYYDGIPGWGVGGYSDYWDFSIRVNDFEINNVVNAFIEDHYEIRYDTYLYNQKEDFIFYFKNQLANKLSSESYIDLTINTIEYLKNFRRDFYYEKFYHQYGVNSTMQTLNHRRIKLVASNVDKLDERDQFLKYIVSIFLDQQLKCIDYIVEFLEDILKYHKIKYEDKNESVVKEDQNRHVNCISPQNSWTKKIETD